MKQLLSSFKNSSNRFLFGLLLVGTFAEALGQTSENGERFTKLMGFTLLKNTLMDVRNKLGNAIIDTIGDVHEVPNVSYLLPSLNVVVTFGSGESGNDELSLTHFSLREVESPDLQDDKLFVLNNSYSRKLFIGKIQVGMKRNELISLLGQPETLEDSDSLMEYEYCQKVSLTEQEMKDWKKKMPTWNASENPFWDSCVYLGITLKDSIIKKIEVFKTVTF